MHNRITLIGALGSVSDCRILPDGTSSCTASLAVAGERVNEKGVRKAGREWFRLLLFAADAERFAVHAKRGMGVWVQGVFQTRPYSQGAQIHRVGEVVVDGFHFLADGEIESESEENDGVQPQ